MHRESFPRPASATTTPAHATTHATGGTDPVTPASIGALSTGGVFGRRVAVASVAAGATVAVTVPFGRTLASTAYTVTSGIESAGAVLLDSITARTTTDVTVRIRNTDGITAHSATVHVNVIVD